MGLCISSPETAGISFHSNVKGGHVSFDRCLHRAERCHSFHHGLLFSDRPLRSEEKLWIRILQDETRWYGALRLGFTSVNPNSMNPTNLPPFACPDLTVLNGYWATGIPEDLCHKGTLISFWVNKKGTGMCQRSEDPVPRVLFSGLPRGKPLWAMLDLYGRTKAVQLLDSSLGKLPCSCTCLTNKVLDTKTAKRSQRLKTTKEMYCASNTGTFCPEQSNLVSHPESLNFRLFLEDEPNCVICLDKPADTILLPCCHCSFCKICAWKVQKQNGTCPLCRQKILRIQGIEVLEPS
ncbi:E3 ubiquitin-protein ligase NEURL3 [Pelodytes ibericus]